LRGIERAAFGEDEPSTEGRSAVDFDAFALKRISSFWVSSFCVKRLLKNNFFMVELIDLTRELENPERSCNI
jgi:hypothetical protein